MNSGTSEDLYDVGAFMQVKPAGETRLVLAVGDDGTILRLAGDGWQPVPATSWCATTSMPRPTRSP